MKPALIIGGFLATFGAVMLGTFGPPAFEERRAERAYRLAVAVGSNVDACASADRVVEVYLRHGDETELRKWAPIRDLACLGDPPADV